MDYERRIKTLRSKIAFNEKRIQIITDENRRLDRENADLKTALRKIIEEIKKQGLSKKQPNYYKVGMYLMLVLAAGYFYFSIL